jgi:hypothetical protein
MKKTATGCFGKRQTRGGWKIRGANCLSLTKLRVKARPLQPCSYYLLGWIVEKEREFAKAAIFLEIPSEWGLTA